MALTLAELKAQNAAQEAVNTEDVPKVEDELETVDDDTEEQAEQESEGDGQAATDEAIEAWQADETEEPASKGSDKHKDLTYDDFAKMRTKLKARITEKDEEVERLRQEVQALKQGTQRPAQEAGTVPKLEDFDFDDAKYTAAMQAWFHSQAANAAKAQEHQSKQVQQVQAIQTRVQSHYQKAAELVKTHGINPDLYGSADKEFRKTIDSVFPGLGDDLAERLIASLGEGSEKLVFSVGRNSTKKDLLKAKLMEDPSGIAASIYLGGLLKDVSAPLKKTTKAPAPAARAEGGESASSNAANFKRKYEKATDPQTRFDIRREAKRAGLDTSNW